MREAVADILGVRQAERLEQPDGALFGFGACRPAVQKGCFDNLLHQAMRRVEGGSRRLRDVAHLVSAQLAQALLAAFQYVAAIQDDLAAGDAYTTAPVAHRGQADGRFASAGFTDQAKHLAPFKGERHIVHDDDVLRRLSGRINRRLDAQIADVEQEV
jgi:hypothetical protein